MPWISREDQLNRYENHAKYCSSCRGALANADKVKKIVPWTLLIFFVYAIVTSPTQAASLVDTAWNILVEGLKSIGDFFNALLNLK